MEEVIWSGCVRTVTVRSDRDGMLNVMGAGEDASAFASDDSAMGSMGTEGDLLGSGDA